MPIKIKAREINGQNGICVKTGNATISFEGIVEEPNKGRTKCLFEVEGVAINEDEPEWYAVQMVEYHYCGYFIRHIRESVKIIKEELK